MLVLVLVEAVVFEVDNRLDQACSDSAVQLADGFNALGDAQQKLVEHRAPLRAIGAAIDGPLKIVAMPGFNRPHPDPALDSRSLILRLVPKNQKVVDQVDNFMIAEESFKSGSLASSSVQLNAGAGYRSKTKNDDENSSDRF
jgi:hypothetical protein